MQYEGYITASTYCFDVLSNFKTCTETPTASLIHDVSGSTTFLTARQQFVSVICALLNSPTSCM